MVLPQPFTTASQAVASYDYTDIANGLGYSAFYATRQVYSTGSEYVLIPQVLSFGGSPGYVNAAEGANLDYDSAPFSLPQTVRGTALISGTFYRLNAGTQPTFRLYHYDGTTETPITDLITCEAVGTNVTKQILMNMPITTEKVFAVGDVIRMTATISGGSSAYGIDPTGVATGINGQVLNPLKILIPFALDL